MSYSVVQEPVYGEMSTPYTSRTPTRRTQDVDGRVPSATVRFAKWESVVVAPSVEPPLDMTGAPTSSVVDTAPVDNHARFRRVAAGNRTRYPAH